MLKYVTAKISAVINGKSTSTSKQDQVSPVSEPDDDQVIYEDAVEYMNCCPELSDEPSLPSLPIPPPVPLEPEEHESNNDETGTFQSMEEALGFSWPMIETPAGINEGEVSNESSNPNEEVVETEPIINSPSKSTFSTERRSSLRILSKKCEITPAKPIKQVKGRTSLNVKKNGRRRGRPRKSEIGEITPAKPIKPNKVKHATSLKVKKNARPCGRPRKSEMVENKCRIRHPKSIIQSALSMHDKGWSYRAIAKWVGPHCSSTTVYRWCKRQAVTAARLQRRSGPSKRELKNTKCFGSMKMINYLDFTSSSNMLESFKTVQMTIPLVRIDKKSIIQRKQLKKISLPILYKKRNLTNHGGRGYTKEQKKMAVSLLDKGVPCRRVAELVGIRSSGTPIRWRRQARKKI